MPVVNALTVSAPKNPFLDAEGPFRLILNWTSATGGAVSLGIVSTYVAQLASKSANPITPLKVQGKLRSVETVPGANGDKATNLPSSYGLTILDAYGYDILAGFGAARSATLAEKILPLSSTVIIDSELTLTIANAGDGKQGRIIMEFEDMGDAKL